MTERVFSFVGFLLFFVLVGVLASKIKKSTTEDYLLAGRNVPFWLTALSAVSTNHSGFMFIGLVGFTYSYGVQSIWLMLGWMLGDALTWTFAYHRIRRLSEQHNLVSVPSLLGIGTQGKSQKRLIQFAALLTFLFLCGYAAAQLKAASTALHVVFTWPLEVGVVVGALVVAMYSFAGGLRASIWTDGAQSIVMVLAMALLLIACIEEHGSWSSLLAQLRDLDPKLVQWIPSELAFGFGVYFLGFVAGGAGVIGQPHVLVRFMSLDSERSIKKTAAVYFLWYAMFSTAAVLVGLYSRLSLPDLLNTSTLSSVTDPAELALPQLAMQKLSDVSIGLILAGVFAATVSTADSQILSCSSALTQDLFPKYKSSYRASKIATLLVTAFSLIIALKAHESVFSLVLLSWSVLAVSIGPVLVARLFSIPISATSNIVMMVVGIVTVSLWKWGPYSGDVFNLLPGWVAVLSISGFSLLLRKRKE